MWIRLRPDVQWRDLMFAAGCCFAPDSRAQALDAAKNTWSADDESILIALSVRSAFDLALRALRLPAGSEIMLTALNVPGMVDIVRSHGLVPVPVDIDNNGAICLDSLREAITPATRMLVVAHLFGGRVPLDEVLLLLRPRQILLVEDAAQGFQQVGEGGHAESDLVLHSFGPIKTATALGGAVARVPSDQLRREMSRILESDPLQSRFAFARRLLRFSILKSLAGNYASAAFCFVLRILGFDVDTLINSIGRGFSASKLLLQIRRRPSAPQLRLLRRRWQYYDFSRIERRKQLGRRLDQVLGQVHDPAHTFWVFPVFSPNAESICRRLRAAGFDATTQSRMILIPSDDARQPNRIQQAFSQILFVPWYPELSDLAVEQMATLLANSNK